MTDIKGTQDLGMGFLGGNGTATVLHEGPYFEEKKDSPNFSVEMEDGSGLDHLTLRLDENDEINAITLTNLLNSGVEEALSNLSPAQLIQLEKNVQKLKKQKNPITPSRSKRPEIGSSTPASFVEKKRKTESSASRNTGGQYMNLPASAPHVELRNGVEWLYFTYSTKGHVQEYCIRIDIDDLSLDDIPSDFKQDNCVYPRALVGKDSYSGNRFEYESSVNGLAWRLTWLNADSLAGKRGLIQRAVDSYRNRTPESRSRRVLRQQKLQEGVLRRRSTAATDMLSPNDDLARYSGNPKTITFQYTSKTGETLRTKLRVDIDSVDINQISDDFKKLNCVYLQSFEEGFGRGSRYEYEAACNEIAWKLAFLNSAKLANQPNILQKAVDAYRTRFETAANNALEFPKDHKNDFSDMVAHTLQQVLGQDHEDIHSQVSLEDHLAASEELDDLDNDDFSHRTVSGAELMGGL